MTEASDLTGAYALNALTDDERAAVEARAALSEATRNELTELQDTAVVLGLATAPVQPSAGLKASLMAQIASMPQLAPLPTTQRAAEPLSTEHEIAEPTRPATTTPATTLPSPAEFKAQARWFSRPVLALTAAAAAVVILIGGGVFVSGVLAPQPVAPVTASGIEAIRAADDAQQAQAEVAGGGTATLVWSGELATAALIADDLPELPADKVYELWYINDSGARPAGIFTVDASGTVEQVLEGDMQSGDMVGVTVEPAGGSEVPTTDPIVGIQA